MIFGPAQGPPFVRVDGVRRDGTMDDLERLLMLTHLTDALDTPGRNILEPNDVPLDSRHLVRALAAIRLTDRVWAGEPSSETAARDCLRMIEIVHGGADAIGDRPVLLANVNVNSPLHFDVRMLEGLITYAQGGQAIIVTPFLLMGAMAPVSVPAALVQQVTEALAGIALVQLVRPGTPCALGSFLSSTDMKSGAPSFGGPESAFGLYASGQIARRLNLPWRAGGGTLTASPAVDFQAGYEAMNTLMSAFLAGANICWQSAGWLEGGLVTSFEKFAADCELLDLLLHQFDPIEVDEQSLAFDAHQEVGQGGHFFGAQHTLDRFRDCFWRATIGTTENIQRWTSNGSREHAARAADRWKTLLESYERPPLADDVEAELVEYVQRRATELGDTVDIEHAAGAARRS
jgi:trimethylamine--corrinoid protein Co-methyltransferase